MNRQLKNALVWRPRITVSDATQRRLWENLIDLRDVSQEASLINLLGDISEICKSVGRLKDASEMHSCRLVKALIHLLLDERLRCNVMCLFFFFNELIGDWVKCNYPTIVMTQIYLSCYMLWLLMFSEEI